MPDQLTPDLHDSAWALVRPLLPDADSAPEADEDLRDHGVDSIRLMNLAESLRARGADVDFADLMAEPTLEHVVRLLAEAEPATESESRG